MAVENKFENAIERFDAANKEDPNTELWQGKTYPKELLYAIRMTDKLKSFAPNASEALQLTARSQHIQRWEIPRDTFEMGRKGYLKWRQTLQKFHVEKASFILKEVGYEQEIIDQVAFLLQKKQLQKNVETQTLEDVICLVFLEYYFEDFSAKHPEEKQLDVLQKTWRKMSPKGHEAALQLPLSHQAKNTITKAIKG
ncbi:hypothetical protein KCTC52924_02825 [Arenibacter antarcticus]|uniref:DUF4202 domain-containing protein n=1 Tax=Arenibacter antarcticus TaxID=2040469 RepID=A0ABW5VG67_9FLAO|nr:DUF4202 domain-containing protein [Arenibacter sp. H213]MCM4167246.1 DUF4202 domain-containing protein [Arenibacter sp. H213]